MLDSLPAPHPFDAGATSNQDQQDQDQQDPETGQGSPAQNAGDPSSAAQRAGAQRAGAQRAADQGNGDRPSGQADPGATTSADVPASAQRDPDEWVTGDEAMTGPQTSYLHTLAREAGAQVPDNLTKAEAGKLIDELQAKSGRGQ